MQKSGKSGSKGRKGLSLVVVDDYIKFMLFLAAIGLVYIWNSHHAERQVKKMESYQQEVKRLKSNYLLKESTLSAGTRLSEIQQIVDTIGLRTLDEPAFKIIDTYH
ncbi:MAG: FtsL-like putative cell division protein [Bacteroidia bacterium]